MALTFQQKEKLVAQIREKALGAQSLVVTHYSGVTVSELTTLRAKGREQQASFQVSRNTLARLALKDTDYEPLLESIKGPVMLAYSFEDPGAAARLLKDFVKEVNAMKIIAFGVSGVAFDGREIDRLASLPTRDEALALVAYLLKAPITTLAQDLSDVPGRLARVLQALKEIKSA